MIIHQFSNPEVDKIDDNQEVILKKIINAY